MNPGRGDITAANFCPCYNASLKANENDRPCCDSTETVNGSALKELFNIQADSNKLSPNGKNKIANSTPINNEDDEQSMINQQLLNIRQHFHSLSTATKSNNYLNINGIDSMQTLSADSALINAINDNEQSLQLPLTSRLHLPSPLLGKNSDQPSSR